MVKNREFANRVEAGIRERERISGGPNERDCRSRPLLYSLVDKSRNGFDTTDKQIRYGLLYLPHPEPGGSTNVEDTVNLKHSYETLNQT
jgi:hypothetical protein